MCGQVCHSAVSTAEELILLLHRSDDVHWWQQDFQILGHLSCGTIATNVFASLSLETEVA